MKKAKSIISIAIIAVICLCFSSFAYADNASMRYVNGEMTISGLDSTASLIHASYDDGVLKNTEITDVTNGTQNINAENGDKFFLWQSVGAMIPLCGIITVGENTESKPIATPEPETGKTLVVYFSASGNTERVANYIANAANADIFELKPVEQYTSTDLNWSNASSRVVREHDNPELQNKVELQASTVANWDEYDTVFVGYPIWWSIAAWPVNQFIQKNDFTGKTVIPFCTAMSSGIGQSGELLAEMAGTGSWQAGRVFRSSADESTVKTWIEGLNL